MKTLITKKQLDLCVAELCERDAKLRLLVARIGPPPQWYRPPGFRTLLYLILEQQVSLASARAAWNKLVTRLGREPSPEAFLRLSDQQLRDAGLSRQKIHYGRTLAEAVLNRVLKLDKLQSLDDTSVRESLTKIKGIGGWTADIYMLEALRRPDIWPIGDLALVVSAQEVFGLDERPSAELLEELGDGWRPWRSVAARILWHNYLSNPKRRGGDKPK